LLDLILEAEILKKLDHPNNVMLGAVADVASSGPAFFLTMDRKTGGAHSTLEDTSMQANIYA
jgi:hypothetical protein